MSKEKKLEPAPYRQESSSAEERPSARDSCHDATRTPRQSGRGRRATRQELERAYQKSTEEARLLYEAGRLLGSTLDPETIFDTMRQLVSEIMPVDSLLVSAFDPQTNLISCSYGWVEGNRVDVSDFPPVPLSPDGRGMQSTVIRTGAPLLILDALERAMASRSHYHVDSDGTVHDKPGEEKPQTRSILMVPIKLEGQVLGVVQIQSLLKDAYTEEDLRMMEAIVLQMAAANRNAFLYQQVKEELEEQRQLQAQLLQSQKMETVGRLAGGISHDFNNLMTVILGHAGLALLSMEDGSEASFDLKRIQQAAHRASELTQQLLAFARKQTTEPRVINLNHLIRDVHRMLRPLFGADVEIVVLPKADQAYVRIDSGHFEQVLINLAVNARDAMPHGGRLVISTDNVTLDDNYQPQNNTGEGRDYVMLSVTDTGCGMTPEVQAHLFEPFFTTKEVGKGTGLGLATCYGIVQQSGGHIQVQSELERGTTFRIYLPRVAEGETPPYLSEARSVLPHGTETLLLVEDDPLVSASVVRALILLGYTVLEAANGEEAIRLVTTTERQIDLVITDIIMPQMGGVELAARLYALYPELPVLFTSGYQEDLFVSRGLDLSRKEAFLQKPFTPELIAQKVRQVLDTSNTRQ